MISVNKKEELYVEPVCTACDWKLSNFRGFYNPHGRHEEGGFGDPRNHTIKDFPALSLFFYLSCEPLVSPSFAVNVGNEIMK